MEALPFDDLNQKIKDAIDAANALHKPLFITYEGLPKAVLLSGKEYEALVAASEGGGREANLLEEAYVRLLLVVASAMDTHESYLAGHTERLAMLSCAVGQVLGMDEAEISELRLAALLHDIGEVVIPIDILQKPGKLSASEMEIIRQHPRVGAEFVSVVPRLARVAETIFSHQERFDGSGYPRGLQGKEIPLHARILAVADSYDALTNLRMHRDSANHPEAIAELQRCCGSKFDPDIIKIFVDIF